MDARRHREINPVTLRRLAANHSDLRRLHRITNVFLIPDRATARRLSDALLPLDMEAQPPRQHAEDASWIVEACVQMVPDVARVNAMTDRCAALAQSHGAEYDGWYTAVETKKTRTAFGILALPSVIVAAAGGLMCAAWLASNSPSDLRLLRSEEQLTRRLEATFAAGSTRPVVRARLEAIGAAIVTDSGNTGFLERDGSPTGVEHIRANLGDYRFLLWRTDVVAFFAFDADGRLVRVEVRKYADSL